MSWGFQPKKMTPEKVSNDGVTEDSTTRKVFGDYEVLKPIGKGKFAIVYRAQRRGDNMLVALKRINVDAIDEKSREKSVWKKFDSFKALIILI